MSSYRHRYYHALVGRFVSRDPMDYWGGIGLYRYCGNSPLLTVDPFGLIPPSGKTWNDCCPKFLKCLEEVLRSMGDTGSQLGTTLRDLDILYGAVFMTRRAYAEANEANANASLWSLLWGGGTGVKPIGAVAITLLGIRKVTGVVTNSRMVRAGLKGFQPMSAGAKASFRLLARVSVYALIADWAIKVHFNTRKVAQVAETLQVLLGVESSVENTRKAGLAQFLAIDGAFGTVQDAYEAFDGKVWNEGDVRRCEENTEKCLEYQGKLGPYLKSAEQWSVGVNGLVGQLSTELTTLIALGAE